MVSWLPSQLSGTCLLTAPAQLEDLRASTKHCDVFKKVERILSRLSEVRRKANLNQKNLLAAY